MQHGRKWMLTFSFFVTHFIRLREGSMRVCHTHDCIRSTSDKNSSRIYQFKTFVFIIAQYNKSTRYYKIILFVSGDERNSYQTKNLGIANFSVWELVSDVTKWTMVHPPPPPPHPQKSARNKSGVYYVDALNSLFILAFSDKNHVKNVDMDAWPNPQLSASWYHGMHKIRGI